MSDEIRIGDRFLVEVEVVLPPDTENDVVLQPDGSRFQWLIEATNLNLLVSKRLPRALKVGDRATWAAARVTIAALPPEPDHCGNLQALVRDASGEYVILPVAHLALAEDTAS